MNPYNQEERLAASMTEQAGSGEQIQAVAETSRPAGLKTELARHPQRPYPMDFIESIFTDFSEIHGDRAFGDDAAMSCGMAKLGEDEALVIANRNGRST